MKAIISTIKRRWKAETPKLVRILQVLSGTIAVIPAYYKDLPDEFRASVPSHLLLYITMAGIIVTAFLQLITTKQKSK